MNYIIAVFFIYLLAGTYAAASSKRLKDNAADAKFEKLGLRNKKIIPLSARETAEVSKQAGEEFERQLEASDPEAQAAIIKAMNEVQRKKKKPTRGDRDRF